MESFFSIDWRVFFTIFASVFIAELGDKTQLATMLFAADGSSSKWMVFAAASAALVVASAIGVLAGTFLSAYISEKLLAYIAGVGFIIIGAVTIYQA
ncbi:TMEM165/GDT1 family protein [Colwellia sp. MEBiC06753]